MEAAVGQIDSRIKIVTPENIAFHYQLAGPARRLVAFLIDMAIRVGGILAAALGMEVAGVDVHIGGGVMLVVWFVVAWFYGGLFETLWNGQTPGKWALGLRVLTADGQPINASQAVLRNILREVDGLPIYFSFDDHFALPLYTLGLVTMIISERHQRWGDLAAGTIVVVEQPHLLRGVVKIQEQAVKDLASQLPTNFVASPSLARAIGAYVERRRFFGPARRAEIARIVGEPLAARFALPPNTSLDLLLCALYYHIFIAERQEDRSSSPDSAGTPVLASGPLAANDSLFVASAPPGVSAPFAGAETSIAPTAGGEVR